MDVDGFVRDYYEALRRGEPLDPYFHERPETVKVGVFSRRVGGEAVAEALRDQTARTEDWTVESRDLRTFEREGFAHFVDDARIAWTDTRADRRHEFETRWTGLVEPGGTEPLFVSMHVSASVDREQRGAEQSEGPRNGAANGVSERATGPTRRDDAGSRDAGGEAADGNDPREAGDDEGSA